MLQKHTVSIHVYPKVLPEGEHIYIVGNHPQLGNWRPDAVPLHKHADGSWRREFAFRKNTYLEYKITRGSWDTEAMNAPGNTYSNHHLKIKDDETCTLDVDTWRDLMEPAIEDGKPVEETTPGERITGTVKFHEQVAGAGLQPRDIIVWLPPGYETDLEARYPVLYMHDGQNIFDPVTSYTGVDWQADETATRLMEAGKMREIIIVGVYNTDDRLAEYSLSPKGKLYRQFLTDTLKPLIDAAYRTLPGREHTATMGSSMGGLVSFLLTWEHPEVFSMAGCLSPSFIYHKNRALKMLKKSPPPGEPVRIYMDCGGIGGEKLLHKGCKKVLRMLRHKGITPGPNFRFSHYKNATHSESAWAERLGRHFEFMFGKN